MYRALLVIALALAASSCAASTAADMPSTTLASGNRAAGPGSTLADTTHAPPPSTTTTGVPRAPITLGFGGDTAFTDGLADRDPLGDVVDMLSAPDFTALNLETVVSEPGVGAALDKTYVFRSPPATVDMLSAAGVDAVSLANNHTLDYGREGLLRTVELVDEGGIVNFGAGSDTAEAYEPAIVEVGDWAVGIVGLTHIECSWVAEDATRWPESAWACPGFEERTVEAVETAAAASDVTVVMVHWGVELEHCPIDHQFDLARLWVDAGADLIIGSHPHLLQGVERLDGAWVLYSTGNFSFPSAREDRAYSAFFTLEIGEGETDRGAVADRPSLALTAHPIRIVDGRPRPLDADSGRDVLATLAGRSLGWTFDVDGTPLPRREPGECG